MTSRLYYDDCYLTEFEATAQVGPDARVYLDRTAFYPTSGGQPHDLGTINSIPVLDVIDEGERIAHVLTSELVPGPVRCRIDWARRYDHMQQHTAQHLLSAVFVNLFGFSTLSFHLGSDVSTIELDTHQLTDQQLNDAESEANRIVQENRPVSISYDDAEAAAGLRKPSARSGTLRIIAIDGLDRSACGGTHVRSTAELGPIQLRGIEKLRGHTRLEFVAGHRALLRARRDYRVAAAIARIAATPIDALPEAIATLRERAASTEKKNRLLETELASMEGAALHAAVPASADGLKRHLSRVAAVDDRTRARLQAFAAAGRALAVAHTDAPGSVLVTVSADAGVHAANVLKAAISAVGAGGGGGSATLAQGRLPTAEALAALLKHLNFD